MFIGGPLLGRGIIHAHTVRSTAAQDMKSMHPVCLACRHPQRASPRSHASPCTASARRASAAPRGSVCWCVDSHLLRFACCLVDTFVPLQRCPPTMVSARSDVFIHWHLDACGTYSTKVQFEAFAWLQLYRPPRSLSLTHALFLSHTLLFPSHATLNKVITRPESEMIS